MNAIQKQIEKMSKKAEETFTGYLGLRMVEVESGKAVIRLDVKPHHHNLLDIVHGGVLASMLDTAMGIAVLTIAPNVQAVTTNLNIHFVAPAKEGSITAVSEVFHQSRSTATLTGTITDESGTVCAMGTASYRILA